MRPGKKGAPRKDYTIMVAMYKSGDFSMGELGKKFNISRQAVAQLLKRRKVKTRPKYAKKELWREED